MDPLVVVSARELFDGTKIALDFVDQLSYKTRYEISTVRFRFEFGSREAALTRRGEGCGGRGAEPRHTGVSRATRGCVILWEFSFHSDVT